ncbi:MAG: glycosyltransferase family 2 protein [Lachnospiraceae bacterium]|nr:glycosyltransferase family 2 protein [Lachnospiraceae bacterium]
MYLDNKIPIIVLNHNDYETTNKFLKNFKEKLSSIATLVFVDNHSTDGSYEKLNTEYKDLGVFIRNDSNLGYGRGNNAGLRYVDENLAAKRVIIANPDIIIESETILKLYEIMEEYKDIKIAAPKMLDTNGIEQVSAWKLQGIIRDGLSSMIVTNRIFKLDKKKYSKRELSEKRLYVEVISGSFFMADMEAFREIGFFDEDTFLYCEENIIGYKFKIKGYKEMLVNNLSYIHAHNATIGKIYNNRTKRYRLLQNSRKVYYRKYLKSTGVALAIFDVMSAVGLFERKIVDKLPLR